MTTTTSSISVAKQQLSISELYHKFVTYYGLTAPWKQRQQRQQQQSRPGLARPPSRRGRRYHGARDCSEDTAAPEPQARVITAHRSTEFPYITVISDVDAVVQQNDDVTSTRASLIRHRCNAAADETRRDVRRQLRVVGRNTATDGETSADKAGCTADGCFPVRIRRYRCTPRNGDDVSSMTSSLTGGDGRIVDIVARSMNYGNRDPVPRRPVARLQRRAELKASFSDSGLIYDSGIDTDSRSTGLLHGNVVSTSCKKMVLGAKKTTGNSLPAVYSTDCRLAPSTASQSTRKNESHELYTDPLSRDVPSSFSQRIGEIEALESRTIRWEKTKRLKKKRSRDSL